MISLQYILARDAMLARHCWHSTTPTPRDDVGVRVGVTRACACVLADILVSNMNDSIQWRNEWK